MAWTRRRSIVAGAVIGVTVGTLAAVLIGLTGGGSSSTVHLTDPGATQEPGIGVAKDVSGKTLPDASFDLLAGGRAALADYRGKPLIVNFFASWCEPCQKETPMLARFYRTEHGKVAIVGLDENDVRAHALSFTRSNGVGYPVGFDPAAVAASAYGVSALPQTFFLDARHHIVDRVFGAVTLADLGKGIALATAKG